MAKKDAKIYDEFEVILNLNDSDRKELRKKVVNTFLNEKGGYWKDGVKHVTRYKYFVENLKDGKRIFLLRPTFLNKGIDFQVWVEKMDNNEDARPSHKGIFQDLQIKKVENPKEFKLLSKAIDRIWNCEDVDKILKETTANFKKGFTLEMLFKILKWLFIEQDITYWNYDGRGMLKLAIDEHFKD